MCLALRCKYTWNRWFYIRLHGKTAASVFYRGLSDLAKYRDSDTSRSSEGQFEQNYLAVTEALQ